MTQKLKPIWAAAALLLFACNSEQKKGVIPTDFDELTAQYFEDKNRLNPLDATMNGQHAHNGHLQFEMTESYRQMVRDNSLKYQKQLASVDTTALNEEQKLSWGIIKWEVEGQLEAIAHPHNLMPVQQFWGTYLTMAQFASGDSAQPFNTVKDYEQFHERMKKYAQWIDSAMVYMNKGIRQKITLPRPLTLKTAAQFQNMISLSAQDNLFYAAVGKMPESFSEQDRKRLSELYANTIDTQLQPRFEKMVAFLNGPYLEASRTTSGIGALPFGDAYYKTLVKHWTTTDMSAEEIHQIGLDEVKRLTSEMEKVKRQVGFKGDIKAFFEHVRNRKELMPFKNPSEVIANFNAIHEKIKPNVDRLFSLQPKMPFEVRRTEAFRENSASAEYMPGATDGSRPGIFYVPIPDVTRYNYFADEDLFLHEAIPGHHFQIALQQENEALPDFRKHNWFGAQGEGWALYTESLGEELGLYKDPYQYFGMLSSEMHRAIRLVVDTGIHAKGWTREQAIQYSLENEAEPEASIISEIERYMAIPGQALSYKIGQLKIMELRQRAEHELKEQFDIKEFHTKVLESGLMPLALLETKINRWIQSEK